jgi:hypothetical protein
VQDDGDGVRRPAGHQDLLRRDGGAPATGGGLGERGTQSGHTTGRRVLMRQNAELGPVPPARPGTRFEDGLALVQAGQRRVRVLAQQTLDCDEW